MTCLVYQCETAATEAAETETIEELWRRVCGCTRIVWTHAARVRKVDAFRVIGEVCGDNKT